jgi:dTMP kinase
MGYPGRVIGVEGLDGSGKQTQAKLLYDRMKAAGIPVLLVSFPNYEQPSSVLVKKYLNGDYSNQHHQEDNIQYVKQISSFYAVDRVSSFIERIYDGMSLIEHLRKGTHIICDRYTTSNILHQSGNLTNKNNVEGYIQWVEELEYLSLSLPQPDVVFYLDVLPEISIDNIHKRYNGEAKEDIHESIGHLNEVYSIKDRVIKYCGWEKVNCCVEGELLPIEPIHESIVSHLKRNFKVFEEI